MSYVVGALSMFYRYTVPPPLGTQNHSPQQQMEREWKERREGREMRARSTVPTVRAPQGEGGGKRGGR
jgi:hypothetical protein